MAKAKARRDKDGKFKPWGKDDKGKYGSYAGTKTHIGKEFKKGQGRPAKPGELHRTKTKSGEPHKGATTWIRTQEGWKHLTEKLRKKFGVKGEHKIKKDG